MTSAQRGSRLPEVYRYVRARCSPSALASIFVRSNMAGASQVGAISVETLRRVDGGMSPHRKVAVSCARDFNHGSHDTLTQVHRQG
jgi:hypothetical protein